LAHIRAPTRSEHSHLRTLTVMSVAMKGKSAANKAAALGIKAKCKAVKASARRDVAKRRGRDGDDNDEPDHDPMRSFIVLGVHNPIVYTCAYKQAFNVPF
jgi:hypothetical protein